MGLILTNQDGSILSTLNITGLQQKNPTKTAVIELGGADKDAIQNFGKKNRTFSFTGVTQSSDEQIYLENLIGLTGSINFESYMNLINFSTEIIAVPGDFDEVDFDSTDFFTGTDYEVRSGSSVYFYSLNWKDVGNRPSERIFTLEAIELI